MINVSELINDPDFSQTFTVTRTTGQWDAGNFVLNPTTFKLYGSIQPLNTKEMAQYPEGDRIKGLNKIYTVQQLYTTQDGPLEDGEDGLISDEVTWQGFQWKILSTNDFSDFGYYQAIAVRKRGA